MLSNCYGRLTIYEFLPESNQLKYYMNLLDLFLIGVIGGLTPGPITALLLGETFKSGYKKGLQIPLAMLFSNLIVAPFSIVILFLGSEINFFLSIVRYIGAGILIFLGCCEWKNSGKLELAVSSNPFKRALMMDMLNPHPYIFWFTILAPAIVLKLKSEGLFAGILCWIIFVTGLVGTKIIIVFLAHRLRPLLNTDRLKIILKILAVCLMFFGLKIFFNISF